MPIFDESIIPAQKLVQERMQLASHKAYDHTPAPMCGFVHSNGYVVNTVEQHRSLTV